MTKRYLLGGAVALCLAAATPAYAQSAGCAALAQAGADAISARIASEDATIRQPTSVRNLTCLGDFFGPGLNLLASVTDFGALVGGIAGQFCATLRNAWASQLGAANCGLTINGTNLGFGLGGGNLCGRLTIGGNGAALGSFGIGGNGTYVPQYNQRPTGY